MLSAARGSCCLPPVSVSVYGAGPGFLPLLFSCRSAGQETVNTHSAAPTHKSAQRAAPYIQISGARGRGENEAAKKRIQSRQAAWGGRRFAGDQRRGARGKPCGAAGGMLQPPLGMCQRGMTLKCLSFSRPSLFIYKSLQNALRSLWGNTTEQELSPAFSPPDLGWSVCHPPLPAPFYFQHLRSFQGNSPPCYCFSVPRS